MKIAIAAALAIMSCALLQAQATPPSLASPQKSSSTAANRLTLSGCVERDTSAPSSTSAFKLTDVEDAAKSASADRNTMGGSSNSATSMSAKLADSYKLDPAASSVQLSQHVNQKVEVIGTVGAASTSGSLTAPRMGSPTLKVTSVRMISSTCQ
jgi:hypothetical protein